MTAAPGGGNGGSTADPRTGSERSGLGPSNLPSDAALESAVGTARTALATTGRQLRGALGTVTAGDVATIAAVLAVALFAGSALVGPGFAAAAIGAGLAAALAVILLACPNPLVRGVGGVLAIPVGLLVATPVTMGLAFAVGVGGFGPVAAIALWALLIGGLAAGLVPWGRADRGGIRKAAAGTMLVGVGVLGVVGLRILPEAGARERIGAVASDGSAVVVETFVVDSGRWAILTFCALVLLAALAVPRGLAYPPLERLLPPERRPALASALDRLHRTCRLARTGALALGIAAFAAPAAVGVNDVPATPTTLRTDLPAPVGDVTASVVTTPGIRWVLVGATAIALAVALVERLRRGLRRGLAPALAKRLAPMAGGALLATAVARTVADPSFDATLESLLAGSAPAAVVDLVASLPAFATAAALLVVAIWVLSSTLFSVCLLRWVRILPPRVIPASMAACAVFVLAAVLALVGRTEPAIWTGAGAFVVWDLGEYANGIHRELGRDAATMRAELVHAAGAVLSGLVVGGATIAFYRWLWRESVAVAPPIAAIGVGAAALVVALVAWAHRG